MVKITNGVEIFEVSKGALKNIYSFQGFRAVEAKKETLSKKSDEDIYCGELLEKPISQWNKEEVKQFCGIKNINIAGTKNANEAKDVIKKYLEENE